MCHVSSCLLFAKKSLSDDEGNNFFGNRYDTVGKYDT